MLTKFIFVMTMCCFFLVRVVITSISIIVVTNYLNSSFVNYKDKNIYKNNIDYNSKLFHICDKYFGGFEILISMGPEMIFFRYCSNG